MEGLHKIVAIKASLNKGLTDKLKAAFPKIIPVPKPSVLNQRIEDPNWLAGFTTGEGCFFCSIYKSKTPLGESVQLIFQLVQHNRDDYLMKSLIEYLECGLVFNQSFGGNCSSI